MLHSPTPLVTVVLPVYNGMPFLPEAVQSILCQTWADFRFLIMDDGSTDETSTYLASLRDPRVRVVTQANCGLGATLNRALHLCETPFVARMDADDVSIPERFACQMKALLRSPSIGMLGCQIAYLIDQHLVPALPFPNSHERICAALQAGRFPLCHPTLIFKTEVARAIAGYPPVAIGEDLHFMLKFSEQTRVANLGGVLLHQRVHANSVSFRSGRLCAIGHRYALHCADLRMHARDEPTLAEFIAEHVDNRPLAQGLAISLEAWASAHYRKHLIDRARGLRFRATLRLILAAMCRPRAVFSRITEYTIRD